MAVLNPNAILDALRTALKAIQQPGYKVRITAVIRPETGGGVITFDVVTPEEEDGGDQAFAEYVAAEVQAASDKLK